MCVHQGLAFQIYFNLKSEPLESISMKKNTLMEDVLYCSSMPTQSTTGLQEEVSPITVIPELVLGFLSLTIEVVSFDPEKGW